MRLSDAAHQAWPPFVLVTGLLLIGIVANADGLFERVGGLLERLPGGPTVLLAGCALVVVLVTAARCLVECSRHGSWRPRWRPRS